MWGSSACAGHDQSEDDGKNGCACGRFNQAIFLCERHSSSNSTLLHLPNLTRTEVQIHAALFLFVWRLSAPPTAATRWIEMFASALNSTWRLTFQGETLLQIDS